MTRQILQTPLAPLAPPEAQCGGRRAAPLEDILSQLVCAALKPMLTDLEERLATRLAPPAKPAPPLPALMTLEDVARYLRVVPRTVQRMVARGELPAPLRLSPNCSRWRRADLDAWIHDRGDA